MPKCLFILCIHLSFWLQNKFTLHIYVVTEKQLSHNMDDLHARKNAELKLNFKKNKIHIKNHSYFVKRLNLKLVLTPTVIQELTHSSSGKYKYIDLCVHTNINTHTVTYSVKHTPYTCQKGQQYRPLSTGFPESSTLRKREFLSLIAQQSNNHITQTHTT